MLNKTFKGGRTARGAAATIDYLLDERVSLGTARVLRGDSELTQSIIDVAAEKFKWSWSSGVLTFEETLTDEVKQEIIDEHEKTFMCGLDPSQFNSLWINHEDKGRTELHYIYPRMELTTGKSINPYFVKRDFYKKDLFQEYINLKYGFSSFKDNIELSRRSENKLWKSSKAVERKKEIDEAIEALIVDGIVDSRDALIDQMREWGYELNRTGKEYISFLHEDITKKDGSLLPLKMKGKQYAESFTSWAELEREVKREAKTVGRGTPREIGAIGRELDEFIRQQTYSNRERYNRGQRRETAGTDKTHSENLQREPGGDEREHGIGAKEAEKPSSPRRPGVGNSIGHDSPTPDQTADGNVDKGRELQDREAHRRDELYRRDKLNKDGEVDNDGSRTEIARRIREIRKRKRRRVGALRDQAQENSGRIIRDISNLNEEFTQKHRRRSRELSNAIDGHTNPTEEDYKVIGEAIEARQLNQSAQRELESVFRYFGNKLESFKRRINKSNKNLFSRIVQFINKTSKDKTTQELNKFKTDINLAEFSQTFGHSLDQKRSTADTPVMQHEGGDQIVVSLNKHDSVYSYSSLTKENDRGSVIDFIRKRTTYTVDRIRETCRAWIKSQQPVEKIDINPSTEETQKIMKVWQELKHDDASLYRFRGLSYSNTEWLAKQRGVCYSKEDRSLYFMMSDATGVCGIEKMMQEGNSILEGSKRGLFATGDLLSAKRVVMFEDPVEMTFYKELGKAERGDLSICTMGSAGETIKESLEGILEDVEDIPFVLAFKNSEAGDHLAEEMQNIIGDERKVQREKPTTDNWNSDLVKNIKSVKPMRSGNKPG